MVMNTSSPNLVDNPGNDIYTLALDADGVMVWDEAYGGTEYEEVFSIIQTNDGGYAIGGITTSEGNGEADLYLIRTNDQGVEQWTSTFGGALGESGGHVAELDNGYFVISGASQSFGSSFLDIYLVGADSMGNELWDQHYNGGGNVDISTDVEPTDDGYFLIAGQRRIDDINGNILSSDLYILKTDAEGNTTTNSIVGSVLWDSDGDCTPDAGSIQLEDWLVEAVGLETYFCA